MFSKYLRYSPDRPLVLNMGSLRGVDVFIFSIKYMIKIILRQKLDQVKKLTLLNVPDFHRAHQRMAIFGRRFQTLLRLSSSLRERSSRCAVRLSLRVPKIQAHISCNQFIPTHSNRGNFDE